MSEAALLPSSDSASRVRRRRRERFGAWELVRLVLPAAVIAAFLLFILSASIVDDRLPWNNQPDVIFPNFSHYNFLQTLPDSHFPVHRNHHKRVIAIGDIHAMNHSLSALLAKISYDPQSDTLIHLGDLMPKTKKISSEPILSFMATNHILGVRGNNDQTVIEWKAWMYWIMTLPGGKEWLKDIDAFWSIVDNPSPKFDAWVKKSHKKWLAYVPDGWKLHGKHYKVAREISREHFDYLCSLPLVLYAPTAHTFFVHAGLLPADPTRDITDQKQPLSHLPTPADPEDGDDDVVLRGLQELALLNEIPQNQDPWVLMNMRSLTEGGRVDDGKNGIPWSDLWNDVMDGCTLLPNAKFYTNPSEHGSTIRPSLRCFPSMVIYGHAAARDLDVKRWSFGLDTGCPYGRRLTAVVLDANSFSSRTRAEALDVASEGPLIPFGDDGSARIVSAKCHT